MADREAYVQKIKAKIDELDAKIDQMEAKVRSTTADMKLKYEDQIAEIRGKRDNARQKLQSVKEAGGGAWKEMKEGMDKAVDALKEAYERAKKHFG